MWKRITIFQLLIWLALASCRSFYTDHSNDLQPIPIFQIQTGTFSDVAWVSDETIVVVVEREDIYNNKKACAQVDLIKLNIKNTEYKEIDLNLRSECMNYFISNLQLLPNQNLGYLFSVPNLNQDISILRQIEITGNDTNLLEKDYPEIDQFSYSPDMKEIIATRVKGIDESKIFFLNQNGDETDVSLGFVRAKSAIWSKNNVIAFFGTKSFEEEKEPFIQFYSFEKYLFYPWQLYLYDPITTETTEIPIEIVGPGELKWSPDGQSLAFRGEIKGIKGVWMVSNLDDLNNLAITRIIDAEATFDFSPDGKSIAFAYIGLQNTDKQNMLFMIDLPE